MEGSGLQRKLERAFKGKGASRYREAIVWKKKEILVSGRCNRMVQCWKSRPCKRDWSKKAPGKAYMAARVSNVAVWSRHRIIV